MAFQISCGCLDTLKTQAMKNFAPKKKKNLHRLNVKCSELILTV